MKLDSYGPTTGNEERAGRPLMQRVLTFSLADEVARLRAEDEWRDGDRNSMTLAKEVDFRVLLSVMRDGATLHDEHGEARTSVEVIEGRARLEVASDKVELSAGELAIVDAGTGWLLHSEGDSAVLLTLAWSREKAGV